MWQKQGNMIETFSSKHLKEGEKNHQAVADAGIIYYIVQWML